jgi:glycosyltransferase involved in cell wall biosynthesis
MTTPRKISIIGTVGLPANYGGFETLVENLVIYHHTSQSPHHITVYCSSKSYPDKKTHFMSAQLKYVPLHANGVQSILYDIVSLLSAIWQRSDTILLLGVSGAIALPLVRLLSSARIITNIDGIEWRREKWQGLAKHFLRFSERLAVRFSHEVVADNGAIAEYVQQTYGTAPHVIAYGGDHAIQVETRASPLQVPQSPYAFAVCRIEPENNVNMVLKAFSGRTDQVLVFVGNWNKSTYGQELRKKYSTCKSIIMLDPIYDLGILKSLRMNASCYIHGHSAGGTNPSLVEAMHFGIPVLAYDCNFNRSTTEDQGIYFNNSEDLTDILLRMDDSTAKHAGQCMQEIAQRRYTWNIVANQYLSLARS